MKKSKLSIGLVTSFICALALAACDSTTPAVTSSKKSIVDFIGYNSKTDKLEINIDEFYREYGDSDEGTTLFYNAVLESLIRYEYKALSEKDEYKDTLRSYNALTKEANEKVEAQIRVATDNAKSNGTTFDEEWDKILDSYKCDSKKDLNEYFLYELEKEAIGDWYFKENKDDLLDQYIGVDENWDAIAKATDPVTNEETHEFEPVYPYHILHVLVKLGADATDYARATITAEEAEKLWSVVRNLMDGNYRFEDVAYSLSEDTSNTAYGDVGIMSTQTSFYNEFKLGIYAYDALLSGVNAQSADNKLIYEAFGVDDEAEVVTEVLVGANGKKTETKEKVVDLVDQYMVDEVRTAVTGYGTTAAEYTAIPTVPYDVFRKMNEYKNNEKVAGKTVDSNARAYPRNVLFNQFLNFGSPFVITNEDVTIVDSQAKVTLTNHNFDDNTTAGNFYLEKNNFDFAFSGGKVVKDTASTGTKQKILGDGNGNVIICVRSTAGIHFMVMRKSIFEGTNALAQKEGDTLQEYYTTEVPGSADYPDSQTYVNMSNSSDPSYYTNRANTIKSKLKGEDSSDTFDAAYDYRIYQKLLNEEPVENKLHFFDEDNNSSKIANNILKKIKLLREGKFLSNQESINDSWESYLAQLRHQNTMRGMKNAILSTHYINLWTDPNADPADFNKGGTYYVE